MVDDSTYKDMYTIFTELAEVWSNMKDVSQARVAEILGGTRNTSGIMSTITNINDAIGAYESALNSASTATRANAIQMDTTKAKIGELKASFQELSTDIISSTAMKGAVGVLRGVIEGFDKLTESIGILGTTLITIGVVKNITSLYKALKNVENIKSFSNILSSLTEHFPKLSAAIVNAKSQFGAASTTMGGLKAGAGALVSSLNTAQYAFIALGAACAIYTMHQKKLQEQMEKAQTDANEWAESSKSIEDYKNKISELREKLDSGALTESQAYDAKAELLSIQEKLTASYSGYTDGIDLVNGKLEEQIGLTDKLAKIEADKFLNSNRDAIERAANKMEDPLNLYLGHFVNDGKESAEAIKKAIKSSQAKYGEKAISLNNQLDMYTGEAKVEVKFNGDASDAEKVLNDFMTDLKTASSSIEDQELVNSFTENAEAGLEKAQGILSKYEDIYRKAKEAEIIADKNLYKGTNGDTKTAAGWMKSYSEAVNEYNKALSEGDASTILEASKAFGELDRAISGMSKKDQPLEKYKGQFEEIREQLDQTTISALNFKDALYNDAALTKQADKLFGLDLDDVDFRQIYETKTDQSGKKEIEYIVDQALRMGVVSDTSSESLQRLASILVDLGIISGKPSEGIEETAISLSTLAQSSEKVVSGISAVTEALGKQKTGKSLDIGDFNSEELQSYKEALEYTNGTMQLNAEKAREIAKAKAEEQIEINKTNKAMTQAKYLDNVKQIEEYRRKLKDANFEKGETTESINKSIDALLLENETIASTCSQYDLLSSSIEEAVGSYQHWLNAQNSSDYGDMATDAISAIQRIRDTYDQNSDVYGDYGSKKFDAAIEFIVPKSVDPNDLAAIESYMDQVKEYMTFDEEKGTVESLNVDKFLDAAVKAGLMSYTKDKGFEILGNKKMEDFANGLNMSAGLVQAFFDELQLKGGKFTWADEADKTIGDLGIAAFEASEKLRQLEQFKNLDIRLDVSDIKEEKDQIEALEDTISQMQYLKAEVAVDSSEAEYANQVIRYCLVQKQQISAPEVMRVDTSLVEGKIGEAIALLQEFHKAEAELEAATQLGLDTTSAKASLDEVTAKVQALEKQVTDALNVDTTSIDSISKSLSGITTESLIKVGIDESAILGYTKDEKKGKGTVTWKNKTTEVDKYAKETKTAKGYVKWWNKTDKVKTEFTATGTINWGDTKPPSNDKKKKKTGKQQLDGTAHAGGNWGALHGGRTLVGELGREIVVEPRTGRWYTVGDNGAEFVDIPKGSIVFNHLQTEDLLANGYVAGRAAALASGTALVDGWQPDKYTPKPSSTTRPAKEKKKKKSSKGSSSSRGSSSSGASESVEKASESVIDFIEIAIKRLTEGINRVKILAESAFKSFSTRNSALAKEMSMVVDKINFSKKAYDSYVSKANSVGLSDGYASQIRNGSLNIETITDEDLSKKIKDYQEWWDKAESVKTSIMELNEELSKLHKDRFDNISEEYSKILDVMNHSKEMIDESIRQSEARGYITSTKYYEALKAQEYENILHLEKEKSALLSSLNNAVASGSIEKYSSAWYDMCNDINDVTKSIEEANTAIIEYSNSIREIEWEVFDKTQEQITGIIEESEFLNKLMENDKKYEDNGQLTNIGKSSMGLHGVNYNVYMAQADKYKQEMLKINRELATDPYNQKLVERKKELIELQQEMILGAESEKQAIKDMVAEGIELELEALQKLIDKFNKAIDAQKDLHDYQNRIDEQTKEIGTLEKQLSSFAGDTSEETQTKIQQIKVDLEEARKNLDETNYDKYISDQKMLLDEMYTEYETVLNERLDNLDALIADMITEINNSSSTINTTLIEKADSVGYTISENMKSIWDTSSTNINNVISSNGTNIVNAVTTVNATLGTINTNVASMIAQLNKIAQTKVESAKQSNATSSPAASGGGSGSSGSSPSYSGSQSSASSGDSSGWGSWFIRRKDNYPKGRLKVNTSIIDRLKYFDFDSSTSARQKYYYAMGGSGRYIGTDAQNIWMINQMKAHGYKKGIFNLNKDEFAWTQEGGKEELFIRPDGGIATLMPKGSSVLNSDATRNLYEFVNSPDKFISEINSNGIKPISGDSYYNYDIDIPIDKVMDFDDFVDKMQHSKRVEKVITSMTTARLQGGSKMDKYKY